MAVLTLCKQGMDFLTFDTVALVFTFCVSEDFTSISTWKEAQSQGQLVRSSFGSGLGTLVCVLASFPVAVIKCSDGLC